MRGSAAALALVACAAFAQTTGRAQAPLVSSGEAGTVSVRAQSAPLGQLLRELAALTPMDLRVDPAVEGVRVSVDLANVPIERAIYAVLQESGVNTVVAGLHRTRGDIPIRVVAGNPREAAPVSGVAAAAAGAAAIEAGGDKSEGESASSDTPALPDDAELRATKIGAYGEAVPEDQPDAKAPGAVTDHAWLQAMFPNGGARVVRGGAVTLPFATDDGRPVVEVVAPGPRTEAMLPFVDEVGLPLVLPIQPRPDGMIMLPFADSAGRPALVPAPPAGVSGARTPGAPIGPGAPRP